MNPTDPFGLAGQVLDGQFRVERLVGEGGFSAVYRGHNIGLNEPVAIKCLKLPPGVTSQLIDTFIRRFQDESRILYRLSQGNLFIVRSISAGTTQSPSTGMLLPYMVLEWLEGRSVANDFTVRKTLGLKGRSVDEVLSLFGTAADALGYAHTQGVIHRDLNPGNLFFAQTPQGVRMKVLDFGVAKLMDDSTLGMGARTQTIGQFRVFAPAYGAPEQFDDNVGPIGPWSDVYSFSLILLEALRDRAVHEGTHLGEFMQASLDPNKRPTPRSLGITVSNEVEEVFAKATILDPRQRFQSAADMWKALAAAVVQKPVTPQAPKAAPKSDPLQRTVPFGSQAMPHKPAGKVGRATVVGIAPPANSPKAGSSPNLPAARPISSTPPRPGPASSPRVPVVPVPPRPGSNPPPSGRSSDMPTDPPGANAMRTDPPTMAAPSVPIPSTKAAPVPSSKDTDPPPTQDEIPDDLDQPEEEVTRVRAPEPDMLRTLSMQEMAAARAKMPPAAGQPAAPAQPLNRTMGMNQAPVRPKVSPAATISFSQHPPQGAPQAPQPQAPNPDHVQTVQTPRFQMPPGQQQPTPAPPPVAAAAPPPVASESDIEEAPDSGGTLVMAPGHQMFEPPPGFLDAPQTAMPQTPVMPPQQQQPPMQQPYGAPPPHQSQLMQPTPQQMPVQQPPMQAMPTPQQMPVQQPMQNAPMYSAQQPMHQQQQRPSQVGPAFPPPSFAQPQSHDAPPAKSNKTMIIALAALGGLLIIGLTLGIVALKARSGADASKDAGAASSSVAVNTPPPTASVPPPPETVTPPAVDAAVEIDEPLVDAGAPEAAAPTTTTDAGPAYTWPPPTTTTTTTTTATTASNEPKWDPALAKSRLNTMNGVLIICKKEGGVTGPGSATVTFAPEGNVTSVALDPPYAGTPAGQCAQQQFQRAKVNPFPGPAQTVRHSFEVPK